MHIISRHHHARYMLGETGFPFQSFDGFEGACTKCFIVRQMQGFEHHWQKHLVGGGLGIPRTEQVMHHFQERLDSVREIEQVLPLMIGVESVQYLRASFAKLRFRNPTVTKLEEQTYSGRCWE